MNIKIKGLKNTIKGELALPNQFKEPVREDLIKRAVLAIQANRRQAYGADPESGKNVSAQLSKRRRKYRGTYGIGQSRTPRKVMSRSGTRFNYTGAFAPQTVGGRRAHPPKADKIWDQKVNKIENRKAIRSALSATIIPELVKTRGHKIPSDYPFAISDEFKSLSKTKIVKEELINLGFKDELIRSEISKVRAGKGTLRGRRHKKKVGVLIVTDTQCDLIKGATNIPGIDVILLNKLNTENLAPGAAPGRVTLFTESAIKALSEKKLFTKEYKSEETAETKVKKKKEIKPKSLKPSKPKKENKKTKEVKEPKKIKEPKDNKENKKTLSSKTQTKKDNEAQE
ncbi:50S ribosomal protein L4 [Candidatus Woesearchaeota archaeon]|nr:50S ribosomal protein L4 [Candidatus Woesearchaeota archaeon]